MMQHLLICGLLKGLAFSIEVSVETDVLLVKLVKLKLIPNPSNFHVGKVKVLGARDKFAFRDDMSTLEVLGDCDLASRIKQIDTDVIESQTDQPCTLTLTARNNKQVVVVLYDMANDCIDKETVAIYDGNSTSGTLLTKRCQGNPWSFASRSFALTLTPVSGTDKPLRPFSLDIHTLDTVKNYTTPTGIIKSERYLGYISGTPNVTTTPNNFHAVYNIVADENVTMFIYFKEFYIQAACLDFMIIHGVKPRLCGYSTNELPSNVTKVTDEMSVEFKTDNLTTYTGFEAEYVACFDKREHSNATENFRFPMYQLTEKMRCFLEIRLRTKHRVVLNMTIHSDLKDRECKDIIRIVTDDGNTVEKDLTKCELNTAITIDLTSNSGVKLQFTSESQNEFVTGIYKTEKIQEGRKSSSSSRSPSSRIITTDNSLTGNQTSSEDNLYTDDDQQRTTETQNISTTILIIAAVATISVIIIIVIVVLVVIRLRKADTTYQQKSTVRNQQDNSQVKYEPNKEEGDIYVGNEDYDVVGKKREHKMSPKENDNIYGRTNESSDEYAVVDRMQDIQKSQPSNYYGDHSFENVYDETKRHSDKARNENFYE